MAYRRDFPDGMFADLFPSGRVGLSVLGEVTASVLGLVSPNGPAGHGLLERRTGQRETQYDWSWTASSSGWLRATRCPPGISSSVMPSRSRASRRWNSIGKNELTKRGYDSSRSCSRSQGGAACSRSGGELSVR